MVAGWVNSRRDHGKIIFLDLRDKKGILQVVCSAELASEIKDEFVIEVTGEVKKRPEKMINPEIETGSIELAAEGIKILAGSEVLPFDLKETSKTSLPVLLDYRPLTLRDEKIRAIFSIEEEVVNSFKKTMRDFDFTEFQAPTIVPVATEGGAEVFRINYYDRDAYLAQSPQLYKQIMVGVFERAYTVAHAYRAEPSVTTRHIAEYVGLDAEMGFINSWHDLMDMCEILIKNIFNDLKINCQKYLKLLDVSLPAIKDVIPRIKMRQAQQVVFEKTGRDNRQQPDLEPEDEKEICQWAQERHGSELIFITHYPTKKRPFYTLADPDDPEYTLSFDMLCRGLEIVTGGQRINDYETLLNNIKIKGMNPEPFEFYLQAFKYGMPPEGGFCLGLERIVKQILRLENLREAALFPRDMGRIDQRLSLGTKEKASKNE